MEGIITLAAAQERFITQHKANNNSERQITHYRRTFYDFDRFLEATNRAPLATTLTTETFNAFAVWLKETPIRPYRGSTQRSVSGIFGHMKDLKAFARYCAEPEQLFITWPFKVPIPRLPKVLFPIFKDDELVTIFTSRHLTGPNEYPVRNRALLALLLDTGIRVSEAAGLTPAAIIGKRYVKVLGKGHRERMVPFSSATLIRLEEWLDMRRLVEVHGTGETDSLWLLTVDGIKQLMKRISADTGLHLHAHKLRHQASSTIVKETGDLYAAKKILGHSSLTTTEIYLSYDDEDLATRHAAASPFAKLDATLRQAERRPSRRLKS